VLEDDTQEFLYGIMNMYVRSLLAPSQPAGRREGSCDKVPGDDTRSLSKSRTKRYVSPSHSQLVDVEVPAATCLGTHSKVHRPYAEQADELVDRHPTASKEGSYDNVLGDDTRDE
jgi:hypothetical protein